MAWRIRDSVVQGEIDNRQKGIVRGKLWLHGLPFPVQLELSGNACPDLAGCLLRFRNRQPTLPVRKDKPCAQAQHGRAGEMTASQKIREDEADLEIMTMAGNAAPSGPPALCNQLYLEWFTECSGRVVLESESFDLEISPPQWRMTPEEEELRQAQANAAWREFLDRLDADVEKQRAGAKDADEPWNEHDYEHFLRVCDARNVKYMELIDKYGHSKEARALIDQEMGWVRKLTGQEAEAEQRDIDAMNAACEAALDEPPPPPDPHREGIDWVRTEDGDLAHPLQCRCADASLRLHRRCKELGLEDGADPELDDFLFEFHMISAKLAGALGGIADGSGPLAPALTVASLKRALAHLHKTQAGLESCAGKQASGPSQEPRVSPALIEEARRELFEIREEILRLMQQYRELAP